MFLTTTPASLVIDVTAASIFALVRIRPSANIIANSHRVMLAIANPPLA
jgi:hypothetical protein